ncbi:hypothetical protein ACGF5O_43350 [Streptomyces sp. NPDC048291]|uniref:hypothetical protein n=1 Tax=Streptomyces sp. NPDC048291 TaxID=3365530 RepID=UPI00371602FF
MTSPAVLSGAAVRVLRTAPARRALQLALLVGGVLALGFLCGQQAQAAEGAASTPSLTSAVTSTLTSAVPHKLAPHPEPGAARKPVAEAVPVVDGVGEVVRSVTGTVSDTVTGTVTSPVVSALTETLTETVTETVRQVTGGLSGVPVVQVPELPVVSAPPAESAPAPVTPAPGPTQAQPRTPVTHDAGREKPRTETDAAGPAASYGPRIAALAFASGEVTHADGHRVDRAGRAVDAPARPAPAGDPDGALGKAAVDGTASRHGDAYAVTFADRAPLRLAPAAAARLDAAGTRDRYRDIPLFPG